MRLALPILWFALAAWFAFGTSSARDDVLGPIPATPHVDAGELDGGPLRAPLSDPPRVRIGGVDQKCSDCHALFDSLDPTPRTIRQHGHIALDHGLNDDCSNCHAPDDRNRLILHDGETVGFERASRLCAQCHGTVYRDWERGMHGKSTGSWEIGSPERRLFECAECHDPHAPAFGAFHALPGPNTWRMGHPSDAEADHEAAERNPLERWKRSGVAEEKHR